MPAATVPLTPGLASFLRSVPKETVETSIENLISLLKRRQIRYSRNCALATAWLLRRVISSTKNADSDKLIKRVQDVGRRLVAAQPRELVVGNIVRRVLGLIREEAEGDRGEGDSSNLPSDESEPATPTIALPGDLATQLGSRPRGSTDSRIPDGPPSRPSLLSSHTTVGAVPPVTSMFSILSHPGSPQPGSPGTVSPAGPGTPVKRSSTAVQAIDLRAEVIEGIKEIIDELDQADEQIAGYALDHIHSNEVILTHTASLTVQRFLLKAATKRKFTVIHAETYPNGHQEVHAAIAGTSRPNDDDNLTHDSFSKPLISVGITVILIPDSAVFALMSRVNKVILGTHAVLANGGLVAAAGARVISMAARSHHVPVVVAGAIYKLSPSHAFDPEAYIEYGDVSKIIPYQDESMVGKVEVENPIFDFVPPDLVDLYITNLGGHAPSYLYRIVQDHYRDEDIEL